ncbi:MAG: arginine--tRNA ligase [Candidatus Methanofastidiosia archaeon]
MLLEIKRKISDGLRKAFLEEFDLQLLEILIETPPSKELGDLATPICLQVSKTLKKSPIEIAKTILKNFENPQVLREVKIAGAGYLNFYLNYQKFSEIVLDEILKGFEFEKKDLKVCIEHTSANPTGPLHMGRLRNSLIGDCLQRIYKFSGYEVEVQNWINDLGKQVAKIAWGFEHNLDYDRDLVKRYEKYKEKPDFQVFFTYYVSNRVADEREVDTLLKRCEAGDRKSLEKLRGVARRCLEGQLQTLSRFGIFYDKIVYESDSILDGSVEEVMRKLKKSKDLVMIGKNYALDLRRFGIEKRSGGTIFQRANGTSVYRTRDVAYHLSKLSLCDYALNVLGEDHKLEFRELKAFLKILQIKTPLEACFFNFVNLEDKKMSTRKGEIVSVDELADEAYIKALSELERRRPELSERKKREISKAIGIGAIKYNFLRYNPEKSITFIWRDALNFEGDSAPYILYAHARCCGILKSEKVEVVEPFLKEEQEINLIRILSEFKEILEKSRRENSPHHLAKYANDLASHFNSFYNELPVLKSRKKRERLMLVKATKIVLKTCLELLGIKALEEM